MKKLTCLSSLIRRIRRNIKCYSLNITHWQNNMQSFTFDQLDERGQAAARERYAMDENVREYCRWSGLQTPDALYRLGWRFTEYGERVA